MSCIKYVAEDDGRGRLDYRAISSEVNHALLLYFVKAKVISESASPFCALQDSKRSTDKYEKVEFH